LPVAARYCWLLVIIATGPFDQEGLPSWLLAKHDVIYSNMKEGGWERCVWIGRQDNKIIWVAPLCKLAHRSPILSLVPITVGSSKKIWIAIRPW